MPVSPDLEGFRAAQARLRDGLGVDAVFLLRAEPVWPPDTPLDPETGRPYDPFIEPVEVVADEEVTVRASFVHRPLDALDPAASPIGAIDRGNAALILTPEDYELVAAARRVRVGEELWDIEQFRHDVALRTPRWVAYLEHA